MEHKDVTIHISTWSVLKIIGIILALVFLYFIRDIALLVFISIILAAVIEPAVNWLEDRRVPRSLGVIVLYVAILLFLALTVRLIIPPIVTQIGLLAQNFPSLWARVVENFGSVQQFSETHGVSTNVQRILDGLQGGLSVAASGLYGFIVSAFQNVINFIMVLVLSYYLVAQRDSVSKLFQAVTPVQHHAYVVETFHAIQGKIGDWARGQLILGGIIGALSFVGLMFLLPEYALVLALIAGMTELIPYLGPILGAIPAVFLGFTAGSVTDGLFILLLYVGIQQLENNLLTPNIMKKQLGLSPVVIIIVMLIGGRVAGIMGLILALPVATSIGVIAKGLLQKSQQLPHIKTELDHESSTSEKNKV